MMKMQRIKHSVSLGSALLLSALLATLCFPTQFASGAPQYSFVYPLMGTRVSSGFGDRLHPVLRVVKHHHGLDLAAPKGAPIRAVRGGTVVFADPFGSYGRLVVLMHENGLTSHYGHCDTIRVKPGQKVLAGEIVGTVGSTGRVTGPHLHFEIRINGDPQDPEKFVPGIAKAAEG